VKIGVVVPTLNEEDTVGAAVTRARETLGDCDVVVVDGGSDDRTRAAATAAGARVLGVRGPRAVAMNAGAAGTDAAALLFLHADTLLPDGAGDAVRRALRDAEAGAFRLGFDERPRGWRTVATLYARSSRHAYGDQAIFVTRAAWNALGGFRPLPIMEDYDLVSRLRRRGRFVLLPLRVQASARRHRSHGELRTFVRIASIKLLYRLGVSPERLARAYRPAR
jgi:rSAM/selenodomain-associated transferase 2